MVIYEGCNQLFFNVAYESVALEKAGLNNCLGNDVSLRKTNSHRMKYSHYGYTWITLSNMLIKIIGCPSAL